MVCYKCTTSIPLLEEYVSTSQSIGYLFPSPRILRAPYPAGPMPIEGTVVLEFVRVMWRGRAALWFRLKPDYGLYTHNSPRHYIFPAAVRQNISAQWTEAHWIRGNRD